MKTENSCEFVDLLYIVVYILDEIKFSFTEIFFYWFGMLPIRARLAARDEESGVSARTHVGREAGGAAGCGGAQHAGT